MKATPVLLLLPLLLAGCGWFSASPATPEPETRPEFAACRREAERDPQVVALGAQAGPDLALNQSRLGPQRQTLLNRAFRDCLRRTGVGMPGGVETIRSR